MVNRNEQRTETVVAILTVIAIFSFAGILSWDDAGRELSERTAPNIVESQVVGGSEGIASALPDESMTVVETAAADVASSASSIAVAGTSLSPAVSQFSVEGGTELSPGTTEIVVGSK